MSTSDDDDWTPAPGNPVPALEATSIIAAFEQKFRRSTDGKHAQVPTWVTFDAATSRRGTLRVLNSKSLQTGTSVFLYFEGREIRRASVPEVRRYMQSLKPWEDWDMYVFDASMSWCIALTHPQMGDRRLVIVAGDLPSGH